MNLPMNFNSFVTFLFDRPKRKVTKRKRAPKSKRNDGFPIPLPIDTRTKQRCGYQNAHHRLQHTNPSILVLNQKTFPITLKNHHNL